MYLSDLHIENFRGIKDLKLNFSNSINVIIGENGCGKSAVIDAIRILYNFASQKKDIFINNEDFYIDKKTQTPTTSIRFTFEFRDLTIEQKGAFYEFLVINKDAPENDCAKVVLSFQYRDDKNPLVEYSTGELEGQKADPLAFELFQHYYLDALRDSTRDLLRGKKSILGNLVLRLVDENDNRANFDKIINDANMALLAENDVTGAQELVNENLKQIYQKTVEDQIGIRIESPTSESLIHSLKPFLPFDVHVPDAKGLELSQNSLGFNNLIYVATILGDVGKRVGVDKLSHYTLLIEEPEAHLHPQLQLSLFNFLAKNLSLNTQVFITSHSPTLTSKVPLNNLIVLEDIALRIDSCFKDRASENIIEDTAKGTILTDTNFTFRSRQLERYLDVTRSQLLFAKGVLFVEGISEEMLMPAFCSLRGFSLEDYRIELVNVGGTSFYPFLHLFNSSAADRHLTKKIAVLTDDDRFSSANDSEYSFGNLVKDDYKKLDELHSAIWTSTPNNRMENLSSVKNGQSQIEIRSSFKTFELELAISNVANKKSAFLSNYLINYLKEEEPDKIAKVLDYFSGFAEDLTADQREKISILIWKIPNKKAEFAQSLSLAILEERKKSNPVAFITPQYVVEALDHVIS